MLLRIACVLLFAGLGFAQSQDRTFYFTRPNTNADLTSLATLTRTILDVQQLVPDERQNALVASKLTAEQAAAAEWLFPQLERPQAGAKAEYALGDSKGEVVRVFQLPATTQDREITALVTAIRTVVDAQRLFPFLLGKAIVARATAPKIAAAQWLIDQAMLPATDAVIKSPEYAWKEDRDAETMRVIHLRKGATPANLTGMITAIRTVVDVQRLFPMESTAAIIMRGPADRMATAEWLIDELLNRSTGSSHQTTMAGLTDGVVHVFYLAHRKSNADLTGLVTQLRVNAEVQRLFPYESASAVIMRGRPDQVAAAQALVERFDRAVQ